MEINKHTIIKLLNNKNNKFQRNNFRNHHHLRSIAQEADIQSQ